jgi:hypothetical protein
MMPIITLSPFSKFQGGLDLAWAKIYLYFNPEWILARLILIIRRGRFHGTAKR